MDERTEITESARLLLRWSWLIIAVAVAAGVVAYGVARAAGGDESRAVAVVAVSEDVDWPHHFSTRDAYIAAVDEDGIADEVRNTESGITGIDAEPGPDASGDVRIVITAEADSAEQARIGADAVAARLVDLSGSTESAALADQQQQVEDELAVVVGEIETTEAEVAAAAAVLADDSAGATPDAEAAFFQGRARLDGLERTKTALEQDLGELRVAAAAEGPELIHVSAAAVDPVTGTNTTAIAVAAAALAAVLTAALIPLIARRRGRVRSAGRILALAPGAPVLDLTASAITSADAARLVRSAAGVDPAGSCAVVTPQGNLGADHPSTPLVQALGVTGMAVAVGDLHDDPALGSLLDADAIVVATARRDPMSDLAAVLDRLVALGLDPGCVVVVGELDQSSPSTPTERTPATSLAP